MLDYKVVSLVENKLGEVQDHKVYFREGMDDLEECLLLFPEVDHDDLFDALDFAMTMADGGNEIRVLKREDFRI